MNRRIGLCYYGVLTAFCLFGHLEMVAQTLVELASKWDDDFSEWIVWTADDTEGELTMTWQMQYDWSSFDYRLGEDIGNIQLKWRDNPNEWETRGDGAIITARTRWPNDFRQWRITDNEKTLILKSKWGNNPNVWILTDDDYGYFEMYMYHRNDFRVWIITDELSEEISLPMKMTMVFLVMFNCTPH